MTYEFSAQDQAGGARRRQPPRPPLLGLGSQTSGGRRDRLPLRAGARAAAHPGGGLMTETWNALIVDYTVNLESV